MIMDRRYLLILVIIIVCSVNLVLVSNYSDVVGSASVDYKEITFSLPPNFNLLSANDRYVQLYSSDFGHIAITYDNDYSSSNYENKINSLKNSTNTTILSNGTVNFKNLTIDTVYYKTIDSENTENNLSSFYFVKDDLHYRVEMSTINSDKRNETINNLIYIIDSIRHNFKK